MSVFYIEEYEAAFRSVVREALASGDPVLDVGRGWEFGGNQLKRYGLSPPEDTEYLTLDVRPEPAPDVAADLAQTPFRGERFSVVFLESVLESVTRVSKLDNCLHEVHRMLGDGGVVAGWVPFCFSQHGGPFEDVHRFTYQGIKSLLNDFDDVWIQPCGGPLSVFLEALFSIGYFLRTHGVEKYETKLRYLLFRDLLSGYEDKQEKLINSVGFRFFAQK
jgi:hypothetical protein